MSFFDWERQISTTTTSQAAYMIPTSTGPTPANNEIIEAIISGTIAQTRTSRIRRKNFSFNYSEQVATFAIWFDLEA